MRILLVCNKFPFPPRDGGSLATFNMARGLAEAGNVVDIAAMNTSRHYSACDMQGARVAGINRIAGAYVDNRVRYGELLQNLLFSSLPYNARLSGNDHFRNLLLSMLLENRYDIVQLESLYLAPLVDDIRKYSGTRISYRAHNVEHRIWESYASGLANPFSRIFFRNLGKRIRKFEKEFINCYDFLVSISPADMEYLDSMGNTKPALVAPFGMFPEEIAVNGQINSCLQYIGALDWRPNIQAIHWFAENVWIRIRDRYPGIRFYVAGRNPPAHIRKKLASVGIEFVGEVENSGGFLSRGGIFISPLFAGSGIRVKIIEAFFMKKPVVATPFSITGIPAEDGKHLLLASTAAGFERSLCRLLDDSEYALFMGSEARKLALSHFDIREICNKLTVFYKKNS